MTNDQATNAKRCDRRANNRLQTLTNSLSDTMKQTIDELLKIISSFERKIMSIHDSEFSAKPDAKKWSKKEVLGHLIDSAQNNLRRFIVGQYETTPKIRYEQDFWVAANGYQQLKKSDVVQHWLLINRQIATVLSNMNTSHYTLQVDSGSDTPELHSLEWLASDYVKHMKHHLNQIIPGSFPITYP